MNVINALSPLQWLVILAVPPAILSLYFLKLRRQPVEVPSTFLWSRTIEDLHVNSIWQRLRQSLLLFLQILVVTLAILACIRPGWRGASQTGDRLIFLIDNSASMSATDTSPTRLQEAKQRVLDLIDRMKGGDVAMVISFSDTPKVEQAFTSVRGTLKQKVRAIRPTARKSDLGEAVRHAAGLANPGRSSADATDVQVADALPADLYIFTDGGFAAVPDFTLGNLEPFYVDMSGADPHNIGLLTFAAERNPDDPKIMQAFGLLQNCAAADVPVKVELYLDGQLLDNKSVVVPGIRQQDPDPPPAADAAPAGDADSDAEAGQQLRRRPTRLGMLGVQFEFDDPGEAVLEMRLVHRDHLTLDNAAFAVISTPRRANVLVVTPGNDALRFAMTTAQVNRIADVAFVAPDVLETKEHQEAVAEGKYDVVVYDQCVPQVMPAANTLFFGNIPPVEGWSAGPRTPAPVIIDTDPVHPLTQLVQMGDVNWNYDGFTITGPEGSSVLMDADMGPLFVIGHREGFQDAAIGLDIVGKYEDGKVGPKTDWPIRRGFPVFVMNALRYLGGARVAYSTASVQPGGTVTVRPLLPVDRLRIKPPRGGAVDVPREGRNTVMFSGTQQLGVYEVYEGRARQPSQWFAVNLFDSPESDLRRRPTITLGYEEVAGRSATEVTRRELWKWLVLLALGVLIFEWYVYNRRVYL